MVGAGQSQTKTICVMHGHIFDIFEIFRYIRKRLHAEFTVRRLYHFYFLSFFYGILSKVVAGAEDVSEHYASSVSINRKQSSERLQVERRRRSEESRKTA